MSIVLSRVDERLVHGRVINDWIAKIKPSHLVIADDALAEDEFMSKIYKALVPLWLKAHILTCASAVKYIKTVDIDENRLFILARSPRAFLTLIKGGIEISEITFADKVYLKNRSEVTEINKRAVNHLITDGVKLYVVNSPSDSKIPLETYPLD